MLTVCEAGGKAGQKKSPACAGLKWFHGQEMINARGRTRR